MKRFKYTLLILMLGLAVPAVGHHSRAGIDENSTITVEGVVTDFYWGNPHSWLQLEVVNDQGETEVWNFEMMPPAYLPRDQGWTRYTLREGDRVKVTANPFFDGSPGGIFQSVTLPNGDTLEG